MTRTTPESRGSIARTAFLRKKYESGPVPVSEPMFTELPSDEQACWVNSARVVWELATAGKTAF